MFEWAYVGVDHTLPGNGGQECVDFIPTWQKIAESTLACLFAACCFKFAYKRVTLPAKVISSDKAGDCGKRILLVVMCLTFGIELGFKLATRQFIWIFNPCHITSMIQIYILAAPPGKFVTAMFRIHLHMLTGAPIAIIFPVINTRLLPFETEVYFFQHTLMMIIPYYLMSIGGVYTPEKLSDMSWGLLSLGWLYFFHFVPLNYLAVLSQVNLNNMLCPAVSDPFYGRHYRLMAMTHQVLALPLVAKVIVFTSYQFGVAQPPDVNEVPVFVSIEYHKRKVPQSGVGKSVVSEQSHANCSGHDLTDKKTDKVIVSGDSLYSEKKSTTGSKHIEKGISLDDDKMCDIQTSGETKVHRNGIRVGSHIGEGNHFAVQGEGLAKKQLTESGDIGTIRENGHSIHL
ncbi:TM164-like protein [Mya arenaria]|uniref:TM164-like protein n=1 Tax=Mya arenaria TaxID=6604 RepID=A0ABY7GB25_MYAAR|nr:transmembrane protein 164-like [Mya arenaria]XP_052783383.1 transmembrane protein 164-like [Mya arenaria]XP_052783384.1 transmembrane protein 164-like [Mya arenaria]WAR28421.1 TM164-like protein [Mya arenaria]